MMQLGDSHASNLNEGQPLWVLGYGQQQSHVSQRRHTIGPGNLAGRRRVRCGGEWLLVTTDILSGHSGGPVVDATCKVIGWAVQSLSDRQLLEQTAFSISETNGGLHAVKPIHEARPLLDETLERLQGGGGDTHAGDVGADAIDGGSDGVDGGNGSGGCGGGVDDGRGGEGDGGGDGDEGDAGGGGEDKGRGGGVGERGGCSGREDGGDGSNGDSDGGGGGDGGGGASGNGAGAAGAAGVAGSGEDGGGEDDGGGGNGGDSHDPQPSREES